MIEELTKKQEEVLDAVRDEWVNYLLNLEFDEQKIKLYYDWIYELNGLEKPKIIILESPHSCIEFCKKGAGKYNLITVNHPNSLMLGLSRQVSNKVSTKARNHVFDFLGRWVVGRINTLINSRIRSKLNFDRGHTAYIFDLTWLSFYDYFDRIGILKSEMFSKNREILKSSIFFSIRFEGMAVVSRPPVFLNINNNFKLHSKNDYALYFKDGYGFHCVEGVYFEPEFFEMAFKKNAITPEEIMRLKNAEQKAVMIKHFGYEAILSKLKNVKVIDSLKKRWNNTDKEVTYELVEFNIEDAKDFYRNVVRVVKVEWWEGSNKRRTVLGVPREKSTEDCIGAIGWTFGLNRQYSPIIES